MRQSAWAKFWIFNPANLKTMLPPLKEPFALTSGQMSQTLMRLSHQRKAKRPMRAPIAPAAATPRVYQVATKATVASGQCNRP